MGEIVYNKLVRGRIPEIIRLDGLRPITRVLGTEAFRRALLEKLVEEARELLESDGDLGERADIAEVLLEIDRELGFDQAAIERSRVDKLEKRGGFEERIFLEATETDD